MAHAKRARPVKNKYRTSSPVPFFSGGEGGIVASRPGMRLRRCACRTGSEVLNHTRQENKMAPQGGPFIFWRRVWDSNPRYGRTVHLISSQAHSTTLAPLLKSAFSFGKMPFGHRTPDLTGRCAPRPCGAPSASKIAPGDFVDHSGTSPMLRCGVGILRR